MEEDTILSILKWIGLVFAAGLIGYFGKYVGKTIIARLSKNKKTGQIDSQDSLIAKSAGKVEKKRLKAEQKKQKKSNKP